MRKFLEMLSLGLLLGGEAAFALTIDAHVEGPLMRKSRVIELLGERLDGPIAAVPDVGQGGNHRLFARVVSQHVGPGSRFLYFVDIQLQRRVVDRETGRVYWPWTQAATSWGTVPSETELREAIEELMKQRVKGWTPD